MTDNDTQLIQSWIDWATNKKGLRASTVCSYGELFQTLLDTKTKSLARLTLADLESFTARQRTGTRAPADGIAAPATIQRETAILRSVFKWLHERGHLARNVTIELVAPPSNNVAPKPVPDASWRTLWGADLSDAERIAYGLAYFTGLRRDEICNLRVGQFLSYPRPTIQNVVRKGGKHQNITWASCVGLLEARRPDLVPGGAESFSRPLERILEGNAGNLVLDDWDGNGDGWFQPDVFNKRLARRCKGLGIAHITPHQFRHSCSTNLISIDVPIPIVARILGHSSIDMTMRYVDTGSDPLAQFIDEPDGSPQPLRHTDRWGRR